MESQPSAWIIVIVIIDFEFQHRADTDEPLKHRGNERPIL
jgi:hypothetical protein